MRVLLTGASGFLGRLLRSRIEADWVCLSRTAPAAAVDWIACDLTDQDGVRELSRRLRVDAIVHAAGNKDIAWCEAHPDEAMRVNVDPLRNLLGSFDAPVLFFSTDYVFDGQHGGYDEAYAPAPQTVYGQTKVAAERLGFELGAGRFVSLRAGAVYDAAAGFLNYLDSTLGAGKTAACYNNATYSPTPAGDVWRLVSRWLDAPARHAREWPGILHLAGDACTRYAFARLYADVFGYDAALVRPARAEGFFFPDLSLSDEKTRTLLCLPRTSHREALAAIRDAVRG